MTHWSDHDRARFGLVGALSAALVAWVLAGPQGTGSAYFGSLLIAVLLYVVVAWCARISTVSMRATVAVAAVLVTGGGLAAHRGGDAMFISILIALLAVSFVSPVLLIVAIVRRQRIDVQALLAALSIYVLLGVTFATGFGIDALVERQAVLRSAAGAADGTFADQLYFSFITLSTTGYGDIAPVSGTARAIALVEAVGGQLYLLTAVAAIVGILVGRGRTGGDTRMRR
jgi:hypothetical protein